MFPKGQHLLVLREYIPTKQGLRLLRTYLTSHGDLREYIPTKQGLRLQETFGFGSWAFLREYIPTKQGLIQQYTSQAVCERLLYESVYYNTPKSIIR